jgi:hypothetical protein
MDSQFLEDLAAEERIIAGDDLDGDAMLRSDRALKDALARIEAPPLPEALRARVLDHHRQTPPPWAWMAMAAAVVLSVLVVTMIEPPEARLPPAELTAQDWAQLSTAIDTLNAQGQQIAQLTQREVGSHLALPALELPRLEIPMEALPYPDSFRRWFQPSAPRTR